MKHTISCALLAVALLSAGGVSAQSDNSGLMLNLHLGGNALSGAGSESVTENGGGLGLAVGYGFNDRIVLYFNLDAASMEYDDEVDAADETYDLATGDLGVRVNFGNEWAKVRPYINAALSGVGAVERYEVLGEEVEQVVTGGGITIGGGLQYFVSPRLALDLGLQATQGAFTDISIDNDSEEFEEGIAFSTSRLQLGVTWHP